MAKWEVTIEETEKYTITVEADSESEAIELGQDAIETELGKAIHHDDSDGDINAFEI